MSCEGSVSRHEKLRSDTIRFFYSETTHVPRVFVLAHHPLYFQPSVTVHTSFAVYISFLTSVARPPYQSLASPYIRIVSGYQDRRPYLPYYTRLTFIFIFGISFDSNESSSPTFHRMCSAEIAQGPTTRTCFYFHNIQTLKNLIKINVFACRLFLNLFYDSVNCQ